MQNQVTVTLLMTGISTLSKTERNALYKKIAVISKDKNHSSVLEANRLLSAITIHRDSYSYEEMAVNVSFQAYTSLSKLLPNQELKVRVTKVGPHIQSGTKSDVTYYNAVQSNYASGQLISQEVGHVDSLDDASLTDSVKLSGSAVCQTLMMLKNVAENG